MFIDLYYISLPCFCFKHPWKHSILGAFPQTQCVSELPAQPGPLQVCSLMKYFQISSNIITSNHPRCCLRSHITYLNHPSPFTPLPKLYPPFVGTQPSLALTLETMTSQERGFSWRSAAQVNLSQFHLRLVREIWANGHPWNCEQEKPMVFWKGFRLRFHLKTIRIL